MVLHPSLTCYITLRCIRNSEIHHKQATVIHMSSQQEESPVQKRFHLKVTYYRRRLIWGWHIIGVLPRPSGATMVLFANALSLVVPGSFALTSAIVVHSLLQLDVHKVYWMYTKFGAIGCQQYLVSPPVHREQYFPVRNCTLVASSYCSPVDSEMNVISIAA